MIITYYEDDLNEIKKDKKAILRLRFALAETLNKGNIQPVELGEIARAIEIIENLLARNAERNAEMGSRAEDEAKQEVYTIENTSPTCKTK